jgi:hypothetical protein
MNWEKLKPPHYCKEPVEYIYTSTIFDIHEYDRLYENQNNLSHQVWQEFDEKYRVGYQFLEDIRDVNLDKDVICLWFFKDRLDRSAGTDLKLAGNTIRYNQNTFLLTESKDIKILEEKHKYKYIRRPAVQLDIKKEKFENIVKRFR